MIRSEGEISREISGRGAGGGARLPDQAARTARPEQAHGEVGGSGSSVDPPESISGGERSGAARRDAPKNRPGRGDCPEEGPPALPQKSRGLQRALYRKAKAEPKFRFYSLYGHICREEILAEALSEVNANGGSSGVDGVRVEEIVKDERTRRRWLEELREELASKRYKPEAVRRVQIPKGEGKTRSLGIPTVKDRVVQTAATIVLGAIFEADFHPRSYGFRPKRSAHQAIGEIKEGLYSGRTEVIDADLKAYFDHIPHGRLLNLVAKRVGDGAVLRLVAGWLRAPVEEECGGGKRRTTNRMGTPQGGVISPLLANLYLNELDHGVNERTGGKARMVRYADDFVILCPPGQSEAIYERVNRWLESRGVSLNRDKSRVVNTREEGFNFLGFGITWRRTKGGRAYVHVEPSVKSRRKLRERIREHLRPATLPKPVGEQVEAVNRTVRGWANYFCIGHPRRVFWQMQDWICEKLRHWLWRKHSRRHGRYKFTKEKLFAKYGLYRMMSKYRQG